MTKGFLIFGLFFLLGACTQRAICPAYQSSFIYDKEAVKQKFSYFNQDSTPKVYTASKNKYLIAVPESYRKKYRKMQTVDMTPVYPIIPDSLKTQDGLGLAESDPTDTTNIAGEIEPGDSTYAITKTKEKYNLDQDLYMWYFRELLVLPDVRAAMQRESEAKDGAPSGAKNQKKGLKGFFQNLFKKKPKNDSTAVTTAVPPTDLPKENATGVSSPEQPKKKKGLFNRKKEEPPKKKEDGE